MARACDTKMTLYRRQCDVIKWHRRRCDVRLEGAETHHGHKYYNLRIVLKVLHVSRINIFNFTVKISVDFTVKYWQPAASPFPVIFYRHPLTFSGIRHRTVAKDSIVFFSYSPTKVFSSTVR